MKKEIVIKKVSKGYLVERSVGKTKERKLCRGIDEVHDEISFWSVDCLPKKPLHPYILIWREVFQKIRENVEKKKP